VRPQLREALAIFQGLGAHSWAAKASRQLVVAEAPVLGQWDERSFDRLTAQERRVADAVADGLSNPETAARLCLSSKTVESHLTCIYRKLGLRSRTELARCYPR
jgi:DNA-binding NarL/FixJ family response regulator